MSNYLKIAFTTLWIWLMPLKGAILAVAALPLVDLVLALSVCIRSKTPIKSSGLKRTIAKIVMYEAATILAFTTETNLLNGLIPVLHIVTGLIGVTELKSCLEHLDDLSGSPLFSSIMAYMAPQALNPSLPPLPTETIAVEPLNAQEGPLNAITEVNSEKPNV